MMPVLIKPHIVVPKPSDFVCELCCNPHYSYILETDEKTNKVAP